MICTKNLTRRPITSNRYQKCDEIKSRAEYLHRLSALLPMPFTKEETNFAVHVFSVRHLSLDESRPDGEKKPAVSDDGARVSEDVVHDENVGRGPDENRISRTEGQQTATLLDDENDRAKSLHEAENPPIPEIAPIAADAASPLADGPALKDNNYNCVDLKGMAKLKKLACLLRRKVVELKTAYEKAPDSGNAYTESERADLDAGLRSLEQGMSRLLNTLNDIDGYEQEMKSVIDIYTVNERQYRKLRLLKKNAKSRVKAEQSDGGDSNSILGTIFKKYVCYSCYKLYKKAYGSKSKPESK